MTQATKTAEAFSKATRDAAEFGHANLEAVTRSAQVSLQGVQELGRQVFDLAAELNTQAVAGAKALAAAKSLKEAADVQARFARSAFERAAGEGLRLQQAALRAAERAFAPLAERAGAAVGRAARPPAA